MNKRKHGCFFFSTALSAMIIASLVSGADTPAGPVPFFVQPLSLLYVYNDVHLIFFFNNHPVYARAEAMIVERSSNPARVRAVFTGHDNGKTEFVNDEKLMSRIRRSNPSCKIHRVDATYGHAIEKGRHLVRVSVPIHDTETVVFDLQTAGKPSAKHGGLTDPVLMPKNGPFPTMVRRQSALADPASSITFNGIAYELPVYINIPVFFKGMRSFYSDNVSMGLLLPQNRKLKILQEPVSLQKGQKWIYADESGELEYEIMKIAGTQYTIRTVDQVIMAELIKNRFHITHIAVTEDIEPARKKYTLDFTPPFPLLPSPETEASTGNFSFSLDGKDALVKGWFRVSGETMVMIPEDPAWAAARSSRTTVILDSKGVKLTTVTGIDPSR